MGKYDSLISKHRPNLGPYEDLYKHFHSHPELSTQENETAATVVSHLKKFTSAKLDIRTGIGGTGLIAILRNGEGKTVLMRADMDGLPVAEKTGLEYASKAKQKDTDGEMKSVMHACGHDFHVTSMLAAAETLISAREEWSGTLIFLIQPAEERGLGANEMVKDGLYDSNRHACPIPDIVLGQHVFFFHAGTTHIRPGPTMAAADSFKVTIYGSGGHGSMPHKTIDPVVIASHVVVRLQTVRSREVPPDELVVVTVGSIQAGHTENVISDEAVLKINIRTVSTEWRTKVVDAVKRIIKAECVAGDCPKEPLIEETSGFPLTVNDEKVTEVVSSALGDHFGEKHDPDMQVVTGSEDFGILGSAVDRPYCFWFFGGYGQDKYDEYKGNPPVNHSPYFAPAIQPTLTTGVDALVVAAMSFVGKG